MLIPEENVKDLQEIPKNVKDGLAIVPVKWIDQVLELALERQPVPLKDEVIAAATPIEPTSAAAVAGVVGEPLKH